MTFGTHKVCHLVDPAAQACGAVHLVDIGLELPEPELEALQPEDVAALLPRPTADCAEVHARRGRRPGRQRAVPRCRPAQRRGRGSAGWPGWSGTSATRPSRSWSRRTIPRWWARAGCRRGWSAPVAATRRGEELHAALADGVPVVVDADALQHLGAGPGGGPDTARRRARGDARRGPAGHRDQAAALRPRGGEEVRRHGPAQGSPHGHRPARRQDPGQHDRHRLARHRRRGRRARRRDRGAAGRRPHAVRRGERRRLAARRGCDARLATAGRWSPARWPRRCRPSSVGCWP